MIYDEKESIKATTENVERELGRSLTSTEQQTVAEHVSQEVAKSEISTLFVWLIVIASVSAWILDKFTGAVSAGYTQYVEPYVLWMISSHSDSILNMILQGYMWVLIVPLAIALIAIFFITALATYGILWLFSFCVRHIAEGSTEAAFFWCLPTLVLLPCIIIVPFVTFAVTAGPASQIVFPLYLLFEGFVKDKIFRLKRFSLGGWLFITHILIPVCLIILVMLFAADKAHLQHRTNIQDQSTFESED